MAEEAWIRRKRRETPERRESRIQWKTIPKTNSVAFPGNDVVLAADTNSKISFRLLTQSVWAENTNEEEEKVPGI